MSIYLVKGIGPPTTTIRFLSCLIHVRPVYVPNSTAVVDTRRGVFALYITLGGARRVFLNRWTSPSESRLRALSATAPSLTSRRGTVSLITTDSGDTATPRGARRLRYVPKTGATRPMSQRGFVRCTTIDGADEANFYQAAQDTRDRLWVWRMI